MTIHTITTKHTQKPCADGSDPAKYQPEKSELNGVSGWTTHPGNNQKRRITNEENMERKRK